MFFLCFYLCPYTKGEGEIPRGWVVFYNSEFAAGQEKGGKRGSYFLNSIIILSHSGRYNVAFVF